jgi:DNA replication protein DnaC
MSRFGDERAELLTSTALIIDDLGAEYSDARGSWLADFDELIDALYSSETCTVITTNLPPKVLAERYGDRVADRIAECATWIAVGGKSMRGKR